MSDPGDPANDSGVIRDARYEAQLRELFNARYPRVLRRRSYRWAVRRAIQHAQAELWLRDVVSFAAAGLTRWLLALFAMAARSPLSGARTPVQGGEIDAGTR